MTDFFMNFPLNAAKEQTNAFKSKQEFHKKQITENDCWIYFE